MVIQEPVEGETSLEVGGEFGVNLEREVWGWYAGDLGACRDVTENMDIFVNLRNITDHDYALGGFTADAIPQETFHGVAGIRLMY